MSCYCYGCFPVFPKIFNGMFLGSTSLLLPTSPQIGKASNQNFISGNGDMRGLSLSQFSNCLGFFCLLNRLSSMAHVEYRLTRGSVRKFIQKKQNESGMIPSCQV